MKNMRSLLLISIAAATAFLAGCDKVVNPYPTGVVSTELDTTLFPGNWSDYEWPSFTENTNTNANVLIEDFTGHTCINCPLAADVAHTLETSNPHRVFVATIHTGPTGVGGFQVVAAPDYPTDWTNTEGLAIGTFFGSIPGSAFQGNPRGTVNRVLRNSQLTESPNSWITRTNAILAANNLRVNIQSEANYFPTTRGVFLHTEVDPIPAYSDGQLGIVTYVIEDSIVGDQKMPDNSHNHEYVHRTVMRGCIDGKAFGRDLTAAQKKENGNYYVDYSYKLPAQYNPDNMHFLIYVYDKSTYEVLQVIEQRITE